MFLPNFAQILAADSDSDSGRSESKQEARQETQHLAQTIKQLQMEMKQIKNILQDIASAQGLEENDDWCNHIIK